MGAGLFLRGHEQAARLRTATAAAGGCADGAEAFRIQCPLGVARLLGDTLPHRSRGDYSSSGSGRRHLQILPAVLEFHLAAAAGADSDCLARTAPDCSLTCRLRADA